MPPEYDYEFRVGEETEWDDLPYNVVPVAENDDCVKIALVDRVPFEQSQIVHADKEVLREREWDSVEEFRQDVDWDYY